MNEIVVKDDSLKLDKLLEIKPYINLQNLCRVANLSYPGIYQKLERREKYNKLKPSQKIGRKQPELSIDESVKIKAVLDSLTDLIRKEN